jgi:hypothetical protein
VNLLRALVFIPLSAGSLYHQWYYTSAGNTGHPASDLFERQMNPEISDPEERLRVTMISARGLRRADLNGSSDPFCICEVLGRPESSVSTRWINKTLTPEWNESFELPLYHFHDSLHFTIRDHDEPSTGCCQFFDDGDDVLGSVILKSSQIHPNGFDGELHLKHAGRYHKNAWVKVKVEILGDNSDIVVDVPIHEFSPEDERTEDALAEEAPKQKQSL